jgi:hypothetical protein
MEEKCREEKQGISFGLGEKEAARKTTMVLSKGKGKEKS